MENLTEITASFQKSRVKTSLKHNQRTAKDKNQLENKGKHIDWNRTDENLHLRDCKSLRKTFNETFKEAVDEYNLKQKRKDRRISDYYSKALGNARLTPTQEFVVQLGNKNTIFKEDPKENRDEWGKLYQTYLDSFENRNPNLRVASATVHFDEKGGPHMHLVTIPIGTYSRGMRERANFDRAMGWNEKKKDFDNFRDFQAWKKQQFANWADQERENLLECAREMGYEINRKKQAKKHDHLEPQEYRALQAKLDDIKQNVYTENENLSAIQKNKSALSLEVSQLKTKKDGYTKDIQSLRDEAEIEKQNVYTLKQQKDEASENLKQLQALVKQLQKQKHDAQEAVNRAYADRKARYLETSTAWGEYRDQMRQLKEDRWNLWHDPDACEEFKRRCRELRETNRALRAWRGGGIIAHTVHFILKLKQLSKEKQLQELKDEQTRAMEELQQRAKELAQQREELLQRSKDAKKAVADAKALRDETNTALKQVKEDLHDAQKYVNFAQQVKQEVKQGKVKPSDAVKQLDVKKPQQRVDETKLSEKQEQLKVDLSGLDDDVQQL